MLITFIGKLKHLLPHAANNLIQISQFRYLNRPVMTGAGLYDPTNIMNADILSRCQREGWIKLAFYLLSFFFYLYGYAYLFFNSFFWLDISNTLFQTQNDPLTHFVLITDTLELSTDKYLIVLLTDRFLCYGWFQSSIRQFFEQTFLLGFVFLAV